MRLVKKLLNHTETYVILIALLLGVAVEAVSHQFFSNTGMVNLARISMIYLIFGVAEMISLVCAGPDVSYPAIASLSGRQSLWRRGLPGLHFDGISLCHAHRRGVRSRERGHYCPV